MNTKDLLDKLDVSFSNRIRETENYINYMVNDIVITVYLKSCYPEFAITDFRNKNVIGSKTNLRFYTETIKSFGIGYDTIYITLYCGCSFEILYRYD